LYKLYYPDLLKVTPQPLLYEAGRSNTVFSTIFVFLIGSLSCGHVSMSLRGDSHPDFRDDNTGIYGQHQVFLFETFVPATVAHFLFFEPKS